MLIHSKWLPALSLPLLCVQFSSAAAGPSATAADPNSARQECVAAMQRIRLNLPETPDSPAVEAYAIHGYPVAARFRRDLIKKADEGLDKAIDQFMQAHAGQPVARGLRHDWLASLAQRRRWDWFLPRSADVADPPLVCERLEGRLATGDTEGLGIAVLARWSLPQKQPAECNDVFAWLRQQNLVTPTLAENRVRAALAADNPRLARELVADVPIARAAALLQWSDLLEAPKTALTVLATHSTLSVEPDPRAAEMAPAAGPDAAVPRSDEIPGLRDSYGSFAADRLHRRYSLNVRPSPDDIKTQTAIAAEPGLIRAHELFDCDMTDEAALEWTTVLGGAEPAAKVQAAHLAARWGWYAESITTLAQAGEWDDVPLRYPRPYPNDVAAASELAGVPADWILGFMRQESLYRKDALSRADARGLIQKLPSTAAAVARQWHLPPPRQDNLFDPSVAVPLGAAYLRELLDRHAGQLHLSLAAYNAGPGPVGRWLPARSMDADVWIENIPYGETRGYVQHILEHIVALAFVGDADPPPLQALMPMLHPAAPASYQ